MSVNAVLSSKSTGNLIKPGKKIKGKNGLEITVPSDAVKYDKCTGSGKNGNFQQYVFKKRGKKSGKERPVQIYTRYDKDGVITDVITDYTRDNAAFNMTRKTVSGDDTTKDYISIIGQQLPTGDVIFTKNFMKSVNDNDMGGVELLRKGKKPVGVEYKYNWDGEPTEITYKNTLGQELDITDTEARYLPFMPRRLDFLEQNGQLIPASADFSADNPQKKVELAQIIQEKLHGIEGIMPRAKAVKLEDLHVVKTSGQTPKEFVSKIGFEPYGENLGNGQINMVPDILNNDGGLILRCMSHEMQHASDTIKMYRGGAEAADEALKNVGMTLEEWNNKVESERADGTDEYRDKVIEKLGLAKKGTPEYDEAVKLYEMMFKTCAVKDLTSVEQHDALPLEQRAIKREGQQMGFYSQICQKVTNFLASFLG